MVAPRRLAVAAALLASMTACSPGTAATTTTPLATTTTEAATTSTTAAPTTTTVAPTTSVPADQTVQVLLQPFSALGAEWTELFLPYGDGEEDLGTSPGGEGLMLGPEYGTQTPDEHWWILDAAKTRAAVYDVDGNFVEGVPFPEEVLVDGQYFQYQMPQGLDDGSIAAGGIPRTRTTAPCCGSSRAT